MNQDLLDHILSFVTDNKKEAFRKVLENRTKHITLVLENVYQPQNASAVVRSCDCFGVQDLHVIESENEYNVNPRIVMGASKWVDIHQHQDTTSAIDDLKAQGFQIIATSPHANDINVQDFIPEQKSAIFFGTEYDGLSDEVMEKADRFVKIPMYGFTESFNISVAAALVLQTVTDTLRNSDINWQLKEKEKSNLFGEWARKCVKNVDIIEQEFLRQQNESV